MYALIVTASCILVSVASVALVGCIDTLVSKKAPVSRPRGASSHKPAASVR